MTLPLISVNGVIGDETTSFVSPRDRGFTLADGLFETMRWNGAAIVRLDAHLERLRAGAALLGIAVPSRLEVAIDAVAQRLERARIAEAAVRLTLTRGIAPVGLGALPHSGDPTLVVVAEPMPSFPEHLRTSGLRLALSDVRRDETSPLRGVKTLSYTASSFALRRARDSGFDDALLLNTKGDICSGTSSNVFVVSGAGGIATPSLECGPLPGTTRGALLGAARELGLVIEERVVSFAELAGASEIILTSALRGVAAASAFGARRLAGVDGEVYRVAARALDIR